MITQQTRLGNITEASLTDNIAQFKKFVKEFKEKNKINYNLTESEAERARRMPQRWRRSAIGRMRQRNR